MEDTTEEETQRMHEMERETSSFASRLYSDTWDAQYVNDVRRAQNIGYLQPAEAFKKLQPYSEQSLQFYPSPVRGFVGRAVIPVPAGPLYSSAAGSDEKGISEKLAEVKQKLQEGDFTQEGTKKCVWDRSLWTGKCFRKS